MASDDELAQTATAAATPHALASSPRAMLGRFRLDGILGQGGMGVVHAAFDSDLERKVALKVLRHAASDDGRARLLREAKAMAKLSHPNVITVFDVGSSEGQDFVAMELVEGGTLGDWVRDERPGSRAILAAFIAAGRGLAAAHAAGLVHRDFKPSNVLRSRSGSIVVTDFGLARIQHEADGPPVDDVPTSSIITRTQTGTIMGTPAYMAPEQWTAGIATPATDQFAFCVALWEALDGERPFRGETLEELRTCVLAGPGQLDSDAIPRPLRAILRRGMAVNPAERWPNMEALLGILEHHVGRRRRWLVGGASVIALVGIAIVILISDREREGVSDCGPPAIDPAITWSAERAIAVRARGADAARLIDGDLATWQSLRRRVCATPPEQRSAKLACLDAALTRIDSMISSALTGTGRIDSDGIAQALIDPALCDRPSPPRLVELTPELVAALTLRRRAVSSDPLTADALALADRATSPCARAVALAARMDAMDEREIAVNANVLFRDLATFKDVASRCDDDSIKAEAAITDSALRGNEIERAEAALAAFPQDDMRAGLEVIRARKLIDLEQWDAAWAASERALELYGHRRRPRAQLDVIRGQIRGLLGRGRAEDVALAKDLYTRWMPIARGLGLVRFEEEALRLRWRIGDVAAADAELEALRGRGGLTEFRSPVPQPPEVDVAGEVFDESGKPVAGATVFSGTPVIGDSVTAAAPLETFRRRVARTDRDGKFTIAGAQGSVIAEAGPLRSAMVAADKRLRLVVRPTSRIEGTVALGVTPAISVWLFARSTEAPPAMVVAPILADGTFTLDGVPRGKIDIGVVPHGTYELGRAQHVVTSDRITKVALAISQTRFHLIARSADVVPPDGALFWIFPKFDFGAHPTLIALFKHNVVPIRSGLFAKPVDLAHVEPDLAGKVQADDMTITIPDRPEGELVACAIGFAKRQFASTSSTEEFGKAMSNVEIACTHVKADQTIVTIDLAPMRKLRN